MTYNIYPTNEGESSVLRGNVSILVYLEVFSIFIKVYLYERIDRDNRGSFIDVFLNNLDNSIPGAGDIKLNKTWHLFS